MHANLKFTIENALDNKLEILNILVHREKHNLYSSIYRKTADTDDYTPFNSYIQIKQKISLISCLTYRVIRICSDRYLIIELENVRTTCKGLGYPLNIVDSTIAKTKDKFYFLKFEPKNVQCI